MAILKCKICGGDMEVSPDKSFGTCEYCGTTMTLPKIDDEQRAAAFNRGNHFRRAGEFDKALQVYEHIITEDPNDAEAHWCCALCRYGIEWVEDPATMEYLPTCHHASFDIFTDDIDCKAAIELSDGVTKRQYQKDAVKIADVQKGILLTSQKEEPFDVFICYKETDENGNRTVDSTLAQDVYYQLTDKGLRVFFARITLEDKAGSQYEPYIFAALHSAKVMVVIATKPEHFRAVWVKNEWSRFLSLVKKDRNKALLPCYKDMDPYDLPEQLAVLQSYDMSKIGFIQDLIRGIEKIAKADKPKAAAKETIAVGGGSVNIAPLLKRAFIFLEDGNWQEADEYCEKVLDQDPENAQAYLGKLMAEFRVKRQADLKACAESFGRSNNFQKAMRYGTPELKKMLEGYIEFYQASLGLLEAVRSNNTERAVELIEAGTDVNYIDTSDKLKCPVLISVIYKGDEAMTKLLLKKGANPNCERIFDDGRRYSALRDAIIQWPNDNIAKMLIKAGADVNYIEINNSPKGLVRIPVLISAICAGNETMVELLLGKGANPNCERVFDDGRRFSALRDAIFQWPNDNIAKMLIEADADINHIEINNSPKGLGRIPVLISAICAGNETMVELLLSKGANPNCERVFDDGRRYSALRDAIIQWPNDNIAKMLIKAGADVNYIEINNSPKGLVRIPVLISAICAGNETMVELLLEKGANPNCERVFDDGRRFSALRDAKEEWPNKNIVKLLKKHGARGNDWF